MKVYAQKQNQTQQQASPSITRPSAKPFAESPIVDSILFLQRTIGNQAVQQLLRANAEGLEAEHGTSTTTRFAHDFSRISVQREASVNLQTKSKVSMPGDVYEKEADRVAGQVMDAPERLLQHQPRKERQEGEGIQTRRSADQVTSTVHSTESTDVPMIVQEVLNSSGQPLDPAARDFMEPRFGHAFSNVRVHTDAKAAESARAVNASAYTVGRDVVFGAGQYVPGTTKGYRLLAHELAHVEQQRGAAPGAVPSVIQRQPSSPAPSPGPSSGATTTPGYVEAAHGPSFRVQIIAHASPRWRGAQNAPDADRRNLELSQRRAEAVRWEVENLLAQHLGTGASVDVDVTVVDEDDTVGVKTEARGSRDTLPEARGDRFDDAQQRRRVDVIVDSSQRVSGVAEAGRPLLTLPTASKFWHVSVDLEAGGAVGAAGSLLTLTLTNDRTGQTMEGRVWALGGGPKASIGASASIWSDPTGFSTDAPLNFSDFDGTWVRYTTLGINLLFIGYEKSYISFVGLGSGAQSIDVGGWNTGTAGIGGSVVAGKLSLVGPYPPTRIPIEDSDKVSVPYERTESGKDVHRVLFATESATLSDLEVDVLDSFIASVVASKR